MKEKLYKLFLILMVSLSLGSGSLAQNEIRKLLEAPVSYTHLTLPTNSRV